MRKDQMRKLLKSIALLLVGIGLGASVVRKFWFEKYKTVKGDAERYLALLRMMDQWVKVKQDTRNLSEYFIKYGYKKIAIYGMGRAGNTLINELRSTEIMVAYGIDKRADLLYADIDIVSIDDTLAEVDAVVVTAITFYDEIEEQLSKKISCPIISLEDILFDI